MPTKKLPTMILSIPTEVTVLRKMDPGLETKPARERRKVKFNIGDEVALVTEGYKIKRRFVEGVHINFVRVYSNGSFWKDGWGCEKYNAGGEKDKLRIQYTLSKPWVTLRPGDYITEKNVDESEVYTLAEASRKIMSFHEEMRSTVKDFLKDISDESKKGHRLNYPPGSLVEGD